MMSEGGESQTFSIRFQRFATTAEIASLVGTRQWIAPGFIAEPELALFSGCKQTAGCRPSDNGVPCGKSLEREFANPD
jgi:hypothetical protein